MNIYLLVILFVLLAIHVSMRYSRSGRLLSKIPGPFKLPIFGSGDPEYLWTLFRTLLSQYYPMGKVWFSLSPVIASRDPEDVKILLADKINITKANLYKCLQKALVTGLIMSDGELWRHRRKIITPAFGPNILKKYLEIMEEQGNKFIAKLLAEGDESVQDLIPLISNLTLCIVCGSAMGVDLNKLEDDDSNKYKNAVSGYLETAVYKAFKPYIPECVFKYMKKGRKQDAYLKVILNFVYKVIKERKQYLKQNKSENFDDFDNNNEDNANEIKKSRKRLAMIDLLLAAKDEGLIDDQGIKDEVNNFIAAGYDTTSIGLVFILMCLAENREIQEKARAEAFEVMDRCQGNMTMDDVQSLNYIERCVKESLRLFPPVPMILRKITQEIQLKNNTIPAGVEFMVPIYDIQRDSRFWKNPEIYDPDKFLAENSENRKSHAYIPFSAGTRICIGYKFAMMELKALTARILYNFSLEPVMQTKDLKFQVSVILLPTVPLYLKFVKLKKDK